MLRGFLTWGLTLAFLALVAAGCNLFSPQSSKSTIEVSSTVNDNTASDCTISAGLNGGTMVTVGNGTYYTFPSVNPGSQSVSLSLATNDSSQCQTSQQCYFNGNTNQTSDNVSFNTTAGNVYVVQVTDGPNASGTGASCRGVSVITP